MSYTWEELIDSQDFEQGKQFIELEKYQFLLEEKDKRINSLQNELSRITQKYSDSLNENIELKKAVKSFRELAIDLWENDASETDWLDVEYYHGLINHTETLAQLSEKGEEE